jgi:hypothetical protein
LLKLRALIAKVVKKKLKKYSKKKKRDTGLEYLEFRSDSDSELETEQLRRREPDPVPDPRLEEEYQLPTLPKPPSLYNEYILQLNKINNKIIDILSSLPCKRYTITITTTKDYLIQRSLYKIEIKQVYTGQIAIYKAKLNTRLSFQKGSSILASDALLQKKVKTRKAAEEKFKKAQTAVTRAENKTKEDLRVKGVAAGKAERDRIKTIQEHQALGIQLAPEI